MLPLPQPPRPKAKARPSVSSFESVMTSSSRSTTTTATEMTTIPELKPLPKTYAPIACVDPTLAIPFDMSILTISHKKDQGTLKALIVGGGIVGLCTAIMMEFGGMEYEILEMTTGEEPPMGSAISLGPSALRLMEQIGLLKDIEDNSKMVTGLTIVDGDRKRVGRFEGLDSNRYGYPTRIMARETLHRIFQSRVPATNIRRGKVVVDTLQNPNGVSVKCSDGSTYYGDIIIGADGTQSLTRAKMHQRLISSGRGVEIDADPSIYDHFGCTGITGPLDPVSYPKAYEKDSEISVIYSKEYSGNLWYMPIPGGRIAWGISSTEETKITKSPLSQEPDFYLADIMAGGAGPISDMTMPSRSSRGSKGSKPIIEPRTNWYLPCDINIEEKFKDIMDKRCALGPGTVRDFIALTPKKSISAIDIQERLYRSWYHERIVLVGDACHQQFFVGGHGPMQGILDAVCLVNLLYEIEFSSPVEISQAFKKYQSKRFSVAKTAMEESSQLHKLFHGNSLVAGMMRKLVLSSVWSLNIKGDKLNNNRPQLSFLPFVQDRGTSKAYKQKVSAKLAAGSRTLSM